MNWKDQIDDIEMWLAKKGYDLIFSYNVEDCVIFADKTVHINSRCSLENQYYAMLHECGHILVRFDKKNWEKEVPLYANGENVNGRNIKGRAYKVSLIAEEIEAWKRGKRLSKRYGHYVNEKKYDASISEFVWSYIEMVTGTEKEKGVSP